MDTASDFRIRLAEKGLSELRKLSPNLKVQKRKEILGIIGEMESFIQIIKYSYISPEEIVEMSEFEKLLNLANYLDLRFSEVGKNTENLKDFNLIQALYWVEYIKSLPDLMRRGEINRACEAIRYFCGEIIRRSEIKDGLWLCLVDCKHKLEIVTNSDEFVQGAYAIVAYLPPRKFGKIVSRGMFVKRIDYSDKACKDELKGELLKLKGANNLSDFCTSEVESIIYDILK